MTLTISSDQRLATRDQRHEVAARLDNPGWRATNAEERRRNQALREAVLDGYCYIPTPQEARQRGHRIIAQIDASRVRLRPPVARGGSEASLKGRHR